MRLDYRLLLQDQIRRSNDAMKIFFIVCGLLIVTGFIIGTIVLTIALPFLVDPVVAEDEEESTCSSYENDTDEQASSGDSDEDRLLTDDEQENTRERDVNEGASF